MSCHSLQCTAKCIGELQLFLVFNSLAAAAASQGLQVHTACPPTSLRPLPPSCTPVLQQLALCTSTASQGAGPATLASLTSLTSLRLYKLYKEVYYNEQMDAMCRQIPITAVAALMAVLGSLPRLHSLTWELGGYGLIEGRPLTLEDQDERKKEVIAARNVEEAAAVQALQSGVRVLPAASSGPPASLRDLHLKFPRPCWEDNGATGPAGLVHKLGLLSWVASAEHLERLVVCTDKMVVEAALQAAGPPNVVTASAKDWW